MNMHKILTFYYENKRYNLYVGKNNFKYFTELDENDNEKIITFEKYLELYSIYNAKAGLIVKDNKKNSKTIIPKVIIRGTATILTPVLIYSGIVIHNMNQTAKETWQEINNVTSVEQEVEDQINGELDIHEETEKLELDTYLESDRCNYTFVYDMDYIDKVIKFPPKSKEEFKEVINNNPNITENFKPLFNLYVDRIFEKYPNIELRPFYQNLENIKVVECTEDELIQHTHYVDSYGCYVRSENTIYVLKGHEYKEGTWDFQVIFHELGHCERTSDYRDENGRHIKIQVEGLNYWDIITAESLNSLFTVSLFNYDERDVAYQLQSNYHGIMIECMDNYSLEDYANHSLSYYALKLDEFNNDEDYATTILSLIEAQYNDFHSYRTHAEQSEFYPIYDYISDMYYRTHINSNMSYDQAKEQADILVERITYDVPEDYNIDTNRFYEDLNTYCSEIGIAISKTK